MNLDEYQSIAVVTLNPALTVEQATLMCTLGLCGESGEVADIVKKVAFHGPRQYFTDEQLLKIEHELGDVLWYIAVLAHSLGSSLDEIAKKNVHKLSQRHKEGFTPMYYSDSGFSV